MEKFAFVSNNSPRMVSMFKESITRELQRQGKEFNVIDESETQITFTGFEAACLADAVVTAMRQKAFRGEHLALAAIDA